MTRFAPEIPAGLVVVAAALPTAVGAVATTATRLAGPPLVLRVPAVAADVGTWAAVGPAFGRSDPTDAATGRSRLESTARELLLAASAFDHQ